MSQCTGCNAEIIWIRMAYSNKMMPVDAKPRKMIQIVKDAGELIDVFMPHWATCSKADQFRKEKK